MRYSLTANEKYHFLGIVNHLRPDSSDFVLQPHTSARLEQLLTKGDNFLAVFLILINWSFSGQSGQMQSYLTLL